MNQPPEDLDGWPELLTLEGLEQELIEREAVLVQDLEGWADVDPATLLPTAEEAEAELAQWVAEGEEALADFQALDETDLQALLSPEGPAPRRRRRGRGR